MSLSSSLIAVKYIGRKQQKHDTVCHTPTTWTPGATRPVSPEVAAKLLAYPNIWIEGDMADVDLPTAKSAQQPVAPLSAVQVKPVPEPEITVEPVPTENVEQPPETFNAKWLLGRPFLAVKNALPHLTDEQIDELNRLERSTKKRPGFTKAIQDDLDRRAQPPEAGPPESLDEPMAG